MRIKAGLRAHLGLAGALGASLMLAGRAAAQDAGAAIPVSGADSPVAAVSGTELPQVLVTARKREERQQDVPASITAFTGTQLDALGIKDIRDLGTYVPGLQFTDLAGYNLIYLRGVGTDAFIPSADPSVATYLDGVYFPSGHSVAQSFGAVERVEVLKGPQGTLFGRNSTGGAVSIITENPGDTPELSIQASDTPRFDERRARVYAAAPLSSWLSASVSGFYDRARNYYTRDPASGPPLPAEVNDGARLKLVLHDRQDLSLIVSGLLMRQTGTSTTTAANTHPSPILGALIPAETRDYVVTANSGPSLTTQTRALYAVAEWKQPWLNTKLSGSDYYVNAYNYVYDFDGSALPIATYAADSEFQRITTGELQLSSNKTSWGASWLNWVGGLYYLHSKGGYNPGWLQLINIDLPTNSLGVQNLFGLLPAGLGNLLDAVPSLSSGATFYFTGLIGAQSYAGYLQATASPCKWLNFTLGGRYQDEKRSLLRSDVGLRNLGGGLTTVISYAPRSSSAANFSPKATLDLHLGEDAMLYASFSQGYKSATYNIINIYTQPTYVDPEKVTAYELGIKSDWLHHLVRANAAVFRNEINNLQTGFVSLTSGGAINFENAGHARVLGAELDTDVVPLPHWDRGLEITGAASWLHARYTSYVNGSGYDDSTGLAFGPTNNDGRNFDGNRIVRTPVFTSTLGLNQGFKVPGGRFNAAVEWYHNSGYYYLAQNSPVSYEPRYNLINAHLSYLYSPWGTRLTVFGQNLNNKRYDLAQFHTDFGREDTLAPPLTVGVRLDIDL
jgi:iron complex outermembrane receptor protein